MTILINNIGDIIPFSPPHVEDQCPFHGGCMCVFNIGCSCVAAGGGCGDLWHEEPCIAM